MNPLVGPVIGRVTETTARILLEYESEVSVTITLNSPSNQQLSLTKILKAKRPTVFKFENLQPNTKYTVKVSPYLKELKSSFRTFKKDTEEKDIKIAWVSCNDAQKNEGFKDRNLWYFFAEEVMQDKYDLCCHIGDQIYLDSDQWKGNKNNAYSYAQEQVFNKYTKDQWNQHSEEIKEIIRQEYRRAWSFNPTSVVLANVPNIMLFDDHDVRDDWGFLEEDWNPNSDRCDYFYGKMCQAVYYEYQRQLWDDSLNLDDTSNINEEYFTLQIGKIGFFFMEIRGERTWHRTEEFDENKMLSTKQWNRFDKALNEEFNAIENLILVSQSTVVFLNHTITKAISLKINDSLEQWVMHQDEQVKLLKKLYDWKFTESKKAREITVICGDVHFGGHADIYYKNKPAFKQFTSSSITNGVKEKYSRLGTTIGLAVSEEIKGGFSFYNHSYTGKNNYGFTHIYEKQLSNGQQQIKVDCCNIVANEESDQKKFGYLETIDNLTYKQAKNDVSGDSSCCTIF